MSTDRRWVAGIHAVETALAGGAGSVLRVLAEHRRRDARMKRIAERAARAGIPLERVDHARLDECAGGARHQGVCAEVQGRAILDEAGLLDRVDSLAGPPFLLALDGVQDPHNLGACLRSAAAAGVDAVIVPRDRAARLTPVVERAAAGTTAIVSLAAVTNLARTLKRLGERGCWITGASGAAPTVLHEADLTGALVLVVGGEGRGLRVGTRAACDRLVAIPLANGVESLNASVATGVCLFEARRQRLLATHDARARRS